MHQIKLTMQSRKVKHRIVGKSMQAIILSAGFATRMYPLTLQSGKSLLPLGGRFVIDFQVDALLRVPCITRIFVVTNEKFYPAMNVWHNGSVYKDRITLVSNGVMEVEERKGAFGDLYWLLEHAGITSDILVLGNDNLFEDDLGGVAQFAHLQQTMTVSIHDFAKTNCGVQTNEMILDEKTFRIQTFRDKIQNVTSPYYASFLYVIPHQWLGMIPAYLRDQMGLGEPSKHFVSWALDRGYPFCGFCMSGRRFDTGDPAAYKKTREWYENKNINW